MYLDVSWYKLWSSKHVNHWIEGINRAAIWVTDAVRKRFTLVGQSAMQSFAVIDS